MHAARVPLLGMAVAVALLIAENLGAVAYREHAVAAADSTVVDVQQATRGKHTEADAQRFLDKQRKIEEIEAELERLSHEAAALSTHHCGND